MAHPYLGVGGDPFVKASAFGGKKAGLAVFATVASFDRSAEFDIKKLHPIADAKDGDAIGVELIKVDIGGVCFAGAFGATGEDDRAWGADVVDVFGLVKFGKKAKFTNAADNELSVLGAEVEDGYVVLVGHTEKRKELRRKN